MRAIMNPAMPPRAPGAKVRKLCQAAGVAGARKQKPAMTTMRTTLSQVRTSWTLPDLRVPTMLRSVISPGDGDGEDLAPEEAGEGGGFEDVEDGEGGEDAGEAGGDGGERGGLGDR